MVYNRPGVTWQAARSPPAMGHTSLVLNLSSALNLNLDDMGPVVPSQHNPRNGNETRAQ